jgi:large subunit ribosomal protein L21
MPETTTGYAVIRTGGKQYRVAEGQTLLIERLTADEGATIELEPLLVAGDGDPVFEADGLGKAKVTATVIGHERGPKIRIFKFKPKRGYKRTQGHRQELTRIRVDSIGSSGSRSRSGGSSKKAEAAAATEEA